MFKTGGLPTDATKEQPTQFRSRVGRGGTPSSALVLLLTMKILVQEIIDFVEGLGSQSRGKKLKWMARV